MPKPTSLSSFSTTLAGRGVSGIPFQYSASIPSTISPARQRVCRCYSRRRRDHRQFSQDTTKPLARLHEAHHRDFNSVFFSRVSSVTSSSNIKRNGKVYNKGSPPGYGMIDGGISGGGGKDHKPTDERVLKLGKTLRKLSPLLPTILINALPSDLLSPQITLHLFPSTHPHLPNVKGRVLYRAALWTVPVAWSSLPLLGNVKLQILSERMVRADSVLGCEHSADCGEERLVVRWKTEPREGSSSSSSNNNTYNNTTGGAGSSSSSPTSLQPNNKNLSTLLGGDTPIFSPGKEGRFEGLFIFAFDDQGRIAGHTIEHADQADGWDRTAKFVTLTDWLLGKARGTLVEQQPALAHIYGPHIPHYRHNNDNGYDRSKGFERPVDASSTSRHIGAGDCLL